MKKIIALLLAFVLVMGLVACGNKAPATDAPAADAPADAPAASGTTKITVMASQDWVKDAELELAEQFTEKTGIEVDYQIIPADQYPNVLTTKLNAGECADIFMHQSGASDIVTLLQIE